jgi:hypothetical protein
MKKLLVAVLGMLCATALVVNAQDATTTKASKKKLTAEQEVLQKDMLAKYDLDKNGKLSKSEITKMSKEDKDKMMKAGLLKAPKAAANTTTATPATPAH